jgi:glycerol-3-phosphate dehydrogenase
VNRVGIADRRASDMQYDLLIVGGGINGAGIARDAAGRGLSVLLCEQDDLASHTSSASTKLIHGGLRYLEYYAFGMVRKALAERETLLASAPHIMRPLEFVLPHDASQRPAWMIRLGLAIYDRLARRRLLPASRALDLRSHPAGRPLQPRFRRGFVYADGWVDDARLVVLNAVGAAGTGARVLTRTACVAVNAADGKWRALLRNAQGGEETVAARVVVNATGPWASQFRDRIAGVRERPELRLIKGSHIIVPALFDHAYAYLLQAPDGRVVFAIPYEGRYTLIGTTDVEHHGEPGPVSASTEEISYLCNVASRNFARPVGPADVVWSFAGIRPLQQDESSDPSGISRDYQIVLDRRDPPLLSVLGGKITTYRRLAEEFVDEVCALLGRPLLRWTAGAKLPGGDLPDGDFGRFTAGIVAEHPWADPVMLRRMARAYGTRIARILSGAGGLPALGPEVLPGLFARELEYLHDEEWARTAEDVLWRRSKLGLGLGADGIARLRDWVRENWR